MPTRFPYGLSFVKPGASSDSYTFVAGDVTPDVSLGTVFFTANSAVTITNFDGGERGKIIFVSAGSEGATIQNSAGGINLFASIATIQGTSGLFAYSATGNYLMLTKETLQFLHNGTDWTQISPSFRNLAI